VDPVNNLILMVGGAGQGTSRVIVYDWTANGNVKPKGIITGPNSEMKGTQGPPAVYPPKKLIIIGMYGPGELGTPDSYFGVWSYAKYGVPPIWKFGGPNQLVRQPRGATVDPAHKTVIVTDKRVNALITWFFPEMF